jgi:predicted house-cleaning NTP pyrophosphatase (Maf/HAM1 superfamily)
MRLVKGISGDFFTVMGLPGGRLIRFVREFNEKD